MNNKKQAYDQLCATYEWNKVRNNNVLDWSLESAMLQEELNEFLAATTDVDRLDALIDLKFVINGTLGKMGLSPSAMVDAYEIVLQANEQKSATLNEYGKVTKPANFVKPEPKLQQLLDER